jgi:hypothetical protein
MSYPVGVVLRDINFGAAIELETGDTVEMKVNIKASRSMVWNGIPVVSIGAQFATADGLPRTVSLPVTDQEGWSDGLGGSIDVSGGAHTHTYLASVEYYLNNVSVVQSAIGPFVLPTGDLSPVDIDNMVPSSGEDAVSIPIIPNLVILGPGEDPPDPPVSGVLYLRLV